MIPSAWIEEAAQRLRGRAVRTPLTGDPESVLSLKLKNRQWTGSFNMRSKFNGRSFNAPFSSHLLPQIDLDKDIR